MKNLFLTTLIFVLASTYNSNTIAKVLPVNEEAESLDNLILPDSDNPDIPDTPILSVGIVKADGLSVSYYTQKRYPDSKIDMIYGSYASKVYFNPYPIWTKNCQ